VLLALDVRDFAFWVREAKKKVLRDRIEAMIVARMAQVKDRDFADEISRLEWSYKEVAKEED
jgi:hypothetical protein